jgi:hypothetical protein
MAKLNFTTAPTFALKVAIPVPGKKAVDVEFTFKGRNREEFREYLDASSSKEDVDALMDTVTGWELAGSLQVIRAKIDAIAPNRSKVSDGSTDPIAKPSFCTTCFDWTTAGRLCSATVSM